MVRLMNRLITNILMSLMVMISMVIPGCTNQPPAIPTAISMPMVDERLMVIESLTLFNDTNNNFIRFIQANRDVYKLTGENEYHRAYIASKQIKAGVTVYNDAITNWTPPDNKYHDRLMSIKKAELYRIEHFSNLTELLINVLPSKNDEAIRTIHKQFTEWKDDERNKKPMELQDDILEELNIHPRDVNFFYIVPDKVLPTLPSLFKGENRS